jgi:hypothetical protein
VEQGAVTPEKALPIVQAMLGRSEGQLVPLMFQNGPKRGTVNFNDVSMQNKLMKADLVETASAIHAAGLPALEMQSLLTELKPHRFAPPTETLQTGAEILAKTDMTADSLRAENKRVSTNDLPLLAVMLRAPVPSGGVSDVIFNNLLAKAQTKAAQPARPGFSPA